MQHSARHRTQAMPAPEPRPLVALPTLPTEAAERAEALASLAMSIVALYGSTAALALAAWLDEAAAEVASDARC